MRVSHSVFIRRPVEQVFAYVTNLTNELRWQPEIKEVRITSPGPLGKGSTFIEVRQSFGRKWVWYFDIEEFEFPRSIRVRSTAGSTMPYVGTRSFEPAPGGTLVTESGELTLPGPLRLFDGLFSYLSRRPLALAYGNLKALLEADT
ncbi:SRPBCC family protein [Hyalangium versicolor]|uniref:SRPBCC family protein n=1 Tax=Hyalangium versicolor TaxID=2861190 RepID=UPI001CCDB1F2|nr:SRPBCC family protein [Hyalangium versicolor]